MAAELHLGDESKLRMPNPFERMNLQAWRQIQAGEVVHAASSPDEYREVLLEAIAERGAWQVRARFDPEGDTEDKALVESLQADGQRMPVLLVESGEPGAARYAPLDGHRRITALRHIGVASVKAVIVRAGTLDCDLISLTANVRKNLTPLEMAQAIARLETQHGLKPDDIAQHVGLTRSYVWDLRRLMKAPLAIMQAVEAKRISAHAALALLKAPEDHQQKALEIVEANQLSVLQAERLVDEGRRHNLAPDEAAARLHLVIPPIPPSDTDKPEPAPSEPTPAAPANGKKQSAPASETTQADLIAYIHEVFSEVTDEQAAGVAELAVEHVQPRKVVRAACLLVLSNWEPAKAVEGAELSARDRQARQIAAMLDTCLQLEELLRAGNPSRECAPLLGGLIRRLTATKRLALELKKK
jgi:ParB family chromosome partitioning protein